MAPLRCCSYNCRGWNSGEILLKSILYSVDLCFIQEHWLITDQLHKINSVNHDFLSVSISSMDSSFLHAGRPFGGCAILYRKSLSLCISPLQIASVELRLAHLTANPISCLVSTCLTKINYPNLLIILIPLVSFKGLLPLKLMMVFF